MKLSSMGLLNWANLSNQDYEFSEITLITGESGAGKTTLLDALQTILTGAISGLFQYNPGQEEATQKSRTKEVRTLASYVLGCDDASYARPEGSHGYIIANWIPQMGEKSAPFTAVVGVSAYLDTAGNKRTAKEEDILLALIPSHTLSISDFQKSDEAGNQHVVPLNELLIHFKVTHPRLNLDICRGKEDYLCRLYGAFRGKSSINRFEARNAARAVSKFMVYKPLKNLDSFVRDEILEPKDMTDAIAQVASMMRAINGMEKEASNIESGVALLNVAKKGALDFITTTIDYQLFLFETLERKAFQFKMRWSETQKKLEDLSQEKKNLEANQDILNEKITGLEDQFRILDARRKGVEVLAQKDQLEKELRRIHQKIREEGEALFNEDRKRSHNHRFCITLNQAVNEKHTHLSNEHMKRYGDLTHQIMDTDTFNTEIMGKMFTEKSFENLSQLGSKGKVIDKLYDKLIHRLQADTAQFSSDFIHSKDALSRFDEKIHRIDLQIAQLVKANKVSYPQSVRRALRLIQEHYPHADPKVLCDHVKVSDPEWQTAIEGLLGGNRFLILVTPEYESRVIELIQKSGLQKTAIIQGKRASKDAKKYEISDNSMVKILVFTHHIAECYVRMAYATVLLVTQIEKLPETARGIMKNGMASARYKMFCVEIAESDLVFGKEARARALKAKEQQLAELKKQHDTEHERYRLFETFLNAANGMTRIDLGKKISRIEHSVSTQQEVFQQLESLDLSEYKELDQKIKEVESELSLYKIKKDKINRTIGSHTHALDTLTNNEKDLKEMYKESVEKRKNRKEQLIALTKIWPDFSPDYSMDHACEKIKENRSSPVALFDPKGKNIGASLNDAAYTVEKALEKFNVMGLRGTKVSYTQFQQYNLVRDQSDESLLNTFQSICQLSRGIDDTLNFLSNDILAKHKEQLSEISEKFNDTFVVHICHTLHNAVMEGKERLKASNRKLKEHFFGEEHYEFEYKWIPEYEEYNRFFQEAALIGSKEGQSLFGNNELSKESKKIFEEIRSKLLDEDTDRSIRDLRRIADYRNYRSYDIKKCLPDKRSISLKTYGSGSGGQMETPSYVIRSSGLSSALRFDDGFSHLRCVMIDESFSKMDEKRCKDVLDYLSETLGLQVIFVVPTKSAGALHDHVDQVIQVTKLATNQKRGELTTQVMVTTNILNKERVSKLWNQKRISIKNKAHQMTFLDLMEGEKGA